MVRGRPCRATLVVSADSFPDIDGSSAAIRLLKHDMRCVARDPDVTVLIVGESGTGKERVARAIHRASPRAHAPFVVIDCSGLSATLAEDALFGHVRGAFTGAIEERPGPFERADGGTVLLDEIGDLPVDLQMKLLRALQERRVQRLGARQETTFDVRVMSATHVDLAAAVARGRFRQDLYYRLAVYAIAVPPLRRRGAGDIRELVAAILRRLALRRRRGTPAIDPEVLDWLIEQPWPGNVRELENVLERMLVAAAAEPVLQTRHLPRRSGAGSAAVERRHDPPAADMILEALRRNGIRYGRTAADLGLSRHQLYRLVRRYDIRAKAGDPGDR
jgi:transcriptional regulator with GAF, ATPase, and Fis domain